MDKVIFIQSTAEIESFMRERQYSSVFILADDNTAKYCLPLLPLPLQEEATLISLTAGESSKNINSCEYIWAKLLEANADRQALLINLGGGMITDLGGFAASTFKRGIDFIHIPTSLLGMVDAAIGGKTGINFSHYKNQVGTFSFAEAVFIHIPFLSTLPQRELVAGLAEVAKYGLIFDKELWEESVKLPLIAEDSWQEVIRKCVDHKIETVKADTKEKGIRKVLNFGHTIGHALESYSLQHNADPLLHGEAVAAGMLMESYISYKKTGLSEDELNSIEKGIKSSFGIYRFERNSYIGLLDAMRKDKKNRDGGIYFVLLSRIGKTLTDVAVSEADIVEAFDYYNQI